MNPTALPSGREGSLPFLRRNSSTASPEFPVGLTIPDMAQALRSVLVADLLAEE